MEIREKISYFFEKQGISNKEIAIELQISEPTVSNYLSGKRQMPLDFFIWFVKKYNPDLEELIYGSDVNIIAEEKAHYVSNNEKMDIIFLEMKKVLKKHLDTK